MAAGIVYLVTNAVNQKRYIGFTTKTLERRKRQHICDARQGKGYRLHAAIRKYGESAFSFQIISQCETVDELIEEEIRQIAKINPEYNVSAGGYGKRSPPSPETLERMSAATKKYYETHPNPFKGKRHTAESRALMSSALTGKPGPWAGKKRPDMSEKMRIIKQLNPIRFWLGKPRSEETKEKIRSKKSGMPNPIRSDADLIQRNANLSKAISSNKKPILCINDGNVFESASIAAKNYGLKKTSVCRVAKGHRTSVFGYSFRYCEA